MISGFKKPWTTKVVAPEAVADAIVGAMRSGREEVFVPRELGPIARMIAGTPPGISDRVNRMLKADNVMAQADSRARAAYRNRMDAQVKEILR